MSKPWQLVPSMGPSRVRAQGRFQSWQDLKCGGAVSVGLGGAELVAGLEQSWHLGGKNGTSSDRHEKAVQVLSLQLSWVLCPCELACGAG